MMRSEGEVDSSTASSTSSPSSKDPVSRLIFELSKLPGIGEKTATRLAYFVIKQDASYSRALAEALVNAKSKIGLCSQCFTFTDTEQCRICTSPTRDTGLLCVVERPSDLMSIEQAGSYRGLYHVLHGALSPLDGVGPEELKIRELLHRLTTLGSSVREIILATNPSVEGESTALYLVRVLRIGAGTAPAFKITKLAHGIPVGGLLEYTDRQTIGKALENRMEVS